MAGAYPPGQRVPRQPSAVAFVRDRLRDPEHGGYFEEADETGRPLRDLPRRQNPHMHWLEAILALNAVAPDGRLLSISQNSALFSLLGTLYGGNGSTNFALPDLRAAAPNGTTYTICDSGVFPTAR